MSAQHLSPEAFVDLLDGAPVDALVRLHLDGCATCRSELDELRETLGALREEASFPTHVSARRFARWALAAAAVLAAAVGSSVFFARSRPDATVTVELEELLPPVDEDEEFQLLQAISDASGVENAELDELAESVFADLALDPSPLTPDERQRFVERLTEEMRPTL